MAVLDEDFGTDLTLAEGNGGVRSSPVSVPERAPRDWRSQCERERSRADAAEANAEELRWAEAVRLAVLHSLDPRRTFVVSAMSRCCWRNVAELPPNLLGDPHDVLTKDPSHLLFR